MNAEITSNLTNLLNINLKIVKNTSIEKMFNELINENPKAFNVNLGVLTNLFDNDEIKSFKKAKKNTELISAFENAKKMEFDEKEIIAELKTDILNSIPELKNKIDSENKGFKNQIIFLEYDFERLWSIGNHWFEVKHNKPITTSKDIITIINEKLDIG